MKHLIPIVIVIAILLTLSLSASALPTPPMVSVTPTLATPTPWSTATFVPTLWPTTTPSPSVTLLPTFFPTTTPSVTPTFIPTVEFELCAQPPLPPANPPGWPLYNPQPVSWYELQRVIDAIKNGNLCLRNSEALAKALAKIACSWPSPGGGIGVGGATAAACQETTATMCASLFKVGTVSKKNCLEMTGTFCLGCTASGMK